MEEAIIRDYIVIKGKVENFKEQLEKAENWLRETERKYPNIKSLIGGGK